MNELPGAAPAGTRGAGRVGGCGRAERAGGAGGNQIVAIRYDWRTDPVPTGLS